MKLTIFILFLILIFILQFIFSGFVASIDDITDTELSFAMDENDPIRERLDRYVDHTYLYRNAFYTFTIILSMLLTLVLKAILTDCDIFNLVIARVLIYILSFVLFLSVSIFLPYYVCSRDPVRFLLRFYHPFRTAEFIFTPALFIMNRSTELLSKLFGSDSDIDPDEVTEDEIISLVNEGHEDGSILASEAAMIQNILSFDEKNAKDIMIHRNDMVCIKADATLSDAINFVIKNHFSRYPIFGEDLDDILGVIHIKDLLDLSMQRNLLSKHLTEIPDLIIEIESVPETHGINTLFTTMQLEKSHMVIVVDEYGQTSGLIAMEDILEEIVGNIQDEHDEEHESISKLNERVYMMEGRTTLTDASSQLGIELTSEDVETLNGYLISNLGRIPDEHETFSIKSDGLRFYVLDVENNVIQGVRVVREEKQNIVV